MSQPENAPGNPGGSEQVKVQHLSARVPEHASRGVFSTGVIVMTGPTEFILDFIQQIGHPPQVSARVVMPHATLPQFAEALRKNIEIFTQRFGPPPPLPRFPPPAKQPTAQEIYDELKMPDSILSGSYANGVMIGHSASEFKFDFLTNLFPHSAVSCRIYMSAPQAPRLLESLDSTFQQFQQRLRPPQGPEQSGQNLNGPGQSGPNQGGPNQGGPGQGGLGQGGPGQGGPGQGGQNGIGPAGGNPNIGPPQ